MFSTELKVKNGNGPWGHGILRVRSMMKCS